MVMPANNNFAHYWSGRQKGLIGNLWSPGRTISYYPWMPYVLDNGKYAATAAKRRWDADDFVLHCDRAMRLSRPPQWIVVPDAIRNAEASLQLWDAWEPLLRPYDVPLAFVLQDGLNLRHIPASADVLFVGGSDAWRLPRLPEIVALGKPVHVGRVNGSAIWLCDRLGVASCDGTGWFRGDQTQLAVLEHYLKWRVGEAEPPQAEQIDLLTQQLERAHFQAAKMQHSVRIPQNIDRSHVLQAIANWHSFANQHRATRYGACHEGKVYPPKLLISRANLYANGQIWHPRQFSGGEEANRFLRRRGFQVIEIY